MRLSALSVLSSALLPVALADFYMITVNEHINDPAENGVVLDRTSVSFCPANRMSCECADGDWNQAVEGSGVVEDEPTDTQTWSTTEGDLATSLDFPFCDTRGVNVIRNGDDTWDVGVYGSRDRGKCVPADGEFAFCVGFYYSTNGYRDYFCTSDICG